MPKNNVVLAIVVAFLLFASQAGTAMAQETRPSRPLPQALLEEILSQHSVREASSDEEPRMYTLRHDVEAQYTFIYYECAGDWVEPEPVLRRGNVDGQDFDWAPDWSYTMCSGATVEVDSSAARIRIPGELPLFISTEAEELGWNLEDRWFYLDGFKPAELEPVVPTEGMPTLTESRPAPAIPMGGASTGVTGTVHYSFTMPQGLVAVAFGWEIDGQSGVVMKAFTGTVDTQVTDGGILVTMVGLGNATYCWKYNQHVVAGYPPTYSYPLDWGAPLCSPTDRMILFSGPERLETGAAKLITHFGFLPSGVRLAAEGYRVNGSPDPVEIVGPQYYAVSVFDGVIEIEYANKVFLPTVLGG